MQVKENEMEIIKKGEIERVEETKMFECKRCGCVFKADRSEYISDQHYDEFYYTCTCPTCGKTVYQEDI